MTLAAQKTRDTWQKVMGSHTGTDLKWGPTNVDRFLFDPKRLAFFMARYKFAAKMLKDCRSIIDVGCGDGMGATTFLSDTYADKIVGVDFERKVIEYACEELLPALRETRPSDAEKIEFIYSDFLSHANFGQFDGAACIDVIEHIEIEMTNPFLENMTRCLNPGGIAVIGTPNAMAAQFGSPHSKIGHINNFSPMRLHDTLQDHFQHVFMFSMNDEIVHTGYSNLAHYLMALCVGPKSPVRPGL